MLLKRLLLLRLAYDAQEAVVVLGVCMGSILKQAQGQMLGGEKERVGRGKARTRGEGWPELMEGRGVPDLVYLWQSPGSEI